MSLKIVLKLQEFKNIKKERKRQINFDKLLRD